MMDYSKVTRAVHIQIRLVAEPQPIKKSAVEMTFDVFISYFFCGEEVIRVP